jgi:prevent-host-death family protein
VLLACTPSLAISIIAAKDTEHRTKEAKNMLQVTIDEAKTRLSELTRQAASGEPFVIADGGKPLVKVAGYEALPASLRETCGPKRSELFGCLRGHGHVAQNLDFKDFCREEIAEMFDTPKL